MGGKNLIKSNRRIIAEGIRDGIPIGLGYLAVSFSLGIAAKNAGLTAFQSFLASLLCNASAGEYSGFTVIAADSAYFEMAVVTLVANARYLLMSCALSQRIKSGTSLIHRLLLGFYITDEFFGITISRKGSVNPYYTYGAILFAAPCWAVGTALGTIAGNLLPLRVVSALSVALFGMFLAIIVPPTKGNKSLMGVIVLSFLASLAWAVGTALGTIAGNLLPLRVVSALSVALFGMFLAIIVPPTKGNKSLMGVIVLSFLASLAFAYLPVISELSEGTRTIILTVAISAAAALLFPVKEQEDDEK